MFSKLVSAFVPALLLASAAQAATPTTVERSIGNVNKRSIGALTALSSKTTVCNVLDYGAVADGTTDIAPAIESAFSSCASKGGATLYVPPGNYSIATGVKLNAGSAWAFQIDGLITLTADGAFGGNAILIERSSDVEIFSSNGLGAINGQGYLTRDGSADQSARLFRLISCTDVSIHDLIFVDSPTFHLILDEVTNLEAYHITVRGPDIGGTDGIDLICTDNCYLHDIEVTNRDECISVKTPSSNVLIEDIYCNHSGGMSIGSLTADDVTTSTEAMVSNITMRNIYVFECTQMLMIKTFPGGSGATGYVKDSTFENFWAYDTTYGLDIDQYWESHTTPDTGAVQLSGLTFSNWTGTVDNGVSRGPIVIRGSDIVPMSDITLEDFNMWTVNEDKLVHQCKNVYGSGYCAATSTEAALATFTTSMTVTATPTAYVSPTSPAWGISGYGTTDAIPIYTPAVFWSPVSSGVAATSVTTAAAIVETSHAAAVSSVKTTSASQTVSVAKTTSTGKTSHKKKTTSTKNTTKTHALRAASASSVTEVAAVQASSSVAVSSSKTKCSSTVSASDKAAYSSSVIASFSSAAAVSASTDAARVLPSAPVASGAIIASANSTSKCTKPASSIAAAYSNSVAASFSSAAAVAASTTASSSKTKCTKPASSLSAAHASSVAASFSSSDAFTASAASTGGVVAVASTKKCTKPATSLASTHASSVAASFSSAAAVAASTTTSSSKTKCTKPASSLASAHASSVVASFSSAAAVPTISSSSKNCTKPDASVRAAHASSVSAGFASGFSTGRGRNNNVVASGVAAPSGFLTYTKNSRARPTFAGRA